MKLRIAIAEDEPIVLEDLRATITELGHEVVAAAANGRELVERCQELEPDLVITDINMPELDGLEAVKLLRDGMPVPIIVSTLR